MRLFRRLGFVTVGAWGLLVVCHVVHNFQEKNRPHSPLQAPPCAMPPEYVAGLAEIGLVEYHVANLVLTLPLPEKPRPGQQRPPCDPDPDLEVAANGGCWVILGKKPPCGRAYEMQHYKLGPICVAPKKESPRTPIAGATK